MRIVIISHTEHYKSPDGVIKGWGATIRELNHVVEICDELIHLAPLHDDLPPDSSLSYTSNKIKFVALKPSGGKGLKKLSIIKAALYNLKLIHGHTKNADHVQFRAPTGMGMYVLPYLKLFRSNSYWVKYAGNWIDPDMPLGNRLQKIWLKYIDYNVPVTINGRWEGDKRFLSFENPSLTSEEHLIGQEIINDKIKNPPNKFRLIFVGSLNRHKGVHLIIDALKKLKNKSHFSEILFVGDGAEREVFEISAKQIDFPIQFLGHCSKEKVAKLLAKSHVLLLPSKSEGFPKVVGEAMNFGCVPIVSNVSCLSDYIKTGENGLVLDDLSSDAIWSALKTINQWSPSNYQMALKKNANLASRFTYQHYNFALKSKILSSEKR